MLIFNNHSVFKSAKEENKQGFRSEHTAHINRLNVIGVYLSKEHNYIVQIFMKLLSETGNEMQAITV